MPQPVAAWVTPNPFGMKGRPMAKYILVPTSMAVVMLLASCSDQGSAPNKPDNPSGGTTPTLSLNDLSTVSEGSNATFAVTLSNASTNDVTVQYTVVNLSSSDNDFSGTLTGTATVPAGSLSTNIVVAVADDSVAEGSELFQVSLSAPTHATLSKSTGAAKIAANDGGVDASFAGDIAPMLSAKGCAGCHGGNGGLFMESVTSLSTTGDHKPDVIPGLGGQSNLYLKTTANWPFGSRMPLSADTLTTSEQNLIRDWINQGAQDN